MPGVTDVGADAPPPHAPPSSARHAHAPIRKAFAIGRPSSAATLLKKLVTNARDQCAGGVVLRIEAHPQSEVVERDPEALPVDDRCPDALGSGVGAIDDATAQQTHD